MKKRPLIRIESSYNEDPKAGIHKLSGKLFGDESGYGFLDKTREEIEDGRIHVILDLRGVTMANSSGLGILASIYNKTKSQDGTLTIVGANEMLQKLLEVIMIWNLVAHADTTEEAVAALG